MTASRLSTLPDHDKWAEELRVKQIDIMFRQLPGVIVGPNIGALLLVFLIWDQVSQTLLLSWLAVDLFFVLVCPALLLWRYRKDADRKVSYTQWGNLLLVFALCGGIAWGSSGYLFFTPDKLEYQMVLFLFMYAAAAVVMTTTISGKNEFYAVVVPMLVPIAVRSAQIGDQFHIIMAITTFVILGLMIFFHKTAHNSLMDSFRLQYENLDLANENARKNQEAEKANREKSRFLAAASHDLRQPLHAQVLFVAELKSRIEDQGSREILGYLEKSMDAMRGLFDALLDISKLDGDMVKPVIRVFPVMNVLSSLEAEYRAQASAKGINLRVVRCSYIIQSDFVLLENILRNLLTNAIRNTYSGSIMICCRKRSNAILIQVRDSGTGIPEDKQEYIFEEFSQLDNPERDREKGLGLGLSIVDRLSKLLQHPLHIRSRPGAGSSFAIEIPLSPTAQTHIIDAVVQPHVISDIAGLQTLIIDDDETILQAMNGLLLSWGCKVLMASSADDAITQLKTSGFRLDIIISDYRLREGRTGVEAIKQIQQHLNSSVPAVLITGDTATERLQEAHASGHQLLHKPVDPGKLLALLDILRPVKASVSY